MPTTRLTPEFLSISPNNKIPAILDPNGPGGKPLPLFESGAILIYLADKSGRLLPDDAAGRYTAIQWLMFQMGGIGPMFGQIGFFHKFAGKDYEDKRPRDRYVAEAKRLLAVVDKRLGESAWLARRRLFDRRHRHLPVDQQPDQVLRRRRSGRHRRLRQRERVLAAFLERPAVVRGLNIPARPKPA